MNISKSVANLLLMFSIIACVFPLSGQSISANVTLIDSFYVNARHSGSWGYTDAQGEDYALLGAFTGLSVISLSDSGFSEVGFVPGNASNWREITAVGDYAYVVSEGGGGLQIVDLSGLPDSISLAATQTAYFNRGHIIGRDIYSDNPYIYVMGSNTVGGVMIFDVSNPVSPVQVGSYNPSYVHDAHIRGDRLYAARLGSGLDIVNISNRSAPFFLAHIDHPSQFTHSSWTTEDQRHLFVTDEVDGLTARIWNIEDLSNIELVAEYSANLQSLVHNPYIDGDFAYISHNTEGLRIVDLADPTLPVEVGYYDTYHGASGGFNGLWSAYPFLSSGKIIGGDRVEGLYVWTFNGTRAARIYGQVTDLSSGSPVAGAQVRLDPAGELLTSDADGRFKIGILAEDVNYVLSATATGYPPQPVVNLTINPGDSLSVTIVLDSAATAITGEPVEKPESFRLMQNYPNPFNPSTTIEFQLPLAAAVTLDIYDNIGRYVTTPYRASLPGGHHKYIWDATDTNGNPVSSGIYYYRLRSGDFVLTRKMLLAR